MTGPEELPPADVLPQEAIAFFRAKGYRIGFSWEDVFRDEHARWFTVAKAMTRDVLEDIREAVDRAIADGITLETFKKELRPKLEAKGWWGAKQMIDPATGQFETVQLGSPRRLQTIFRTNVRTAYAAGKWERIQRTKRAFPFLEYSSVMDGRERPEHHAWDGTILPVDDPWWDTHTPPCDWECRCDIVARSQRMLDRKGLKVDAAPPPPNPTYQAVNKRTGEVFTLEKGIGKGWDYNVGKEYLRGLVPGPLPESFDGGPEEIGAAAQLTPAQTALVDRFLAAFGIAPGKEAIWTDREGWPLSIGRGWFIGPAGRIALPRGAAGVAIDRIAAAIVQADNIRWVWIKALDGRALLMRRYARTSAGVTTLVDVGREGWRWVSGRAEEIAAAYDPRQARDRNGRWSRSGGLSSSVTELVAPLSASEEYAVERYTGLAYQAINNSLRGIGFEDDGENDDFEQLTIDLDRAVAKGRLKHDMRLYRGIGGDGVQDIRALNLRRGAVFADPGFTSTSKDWITADRFAQGRGLLLIVHAKAGMTALDVTRASSVGTGEYEVLFPRDRLWKVRHVDDAKGLIEVEAEGS